VYNLQFSVLVMTPYIVPSVFSSTQATLGILSLMLSPSRHTMSSSWMSCNWLSRV